MDATLEATLEPELCSLNVRGIEFIRLVRKVGIAGKATTNKEG